MDHEENVLPREAVQVLKSSQFLHLGTADKTGRPHVSLMNYTFFARGSAAPYTESDCIIMTCPRETKKFFNISVNPYVSMLVHDWSMQRPATGPMSDTSPLQSFLLGLNQLQLSKSTSATLSGQAQVLDSAGEEAKFFRQQHAASNRDLGADTYVMGEDIAVIKVCIESVRMIVGGAEGRLEKWRDDGAESTPATS